MDEKLSNFSDYFETQIALCNRRREVLLADGRADEATFEKVRANIYDIFRTVLSVAVQHCEGQPDAVGQFFLLRLQNIPESWESAYENAKTHNDTEKIYLEQLKLDTVAQIRERFTDIWGEIK